ESTYAKALLGNCDRFFALSWLMAVRFVLGRPLARRAAPRSQTILHPEARRHGRREREGGQWGGVKGAPESALYCDPVVPRLGRGRMSHGHPLDRYIGDAYPDLEGPRDVVSFMLPLLPQSYMVLFGAEAAGIVNPVNPMLEVGQIAEILKAAGTKVLVTLGPMPGTEIWDKSQQVRPLVPSLERVLQ